MPFRCCVPGCNYSAAEKVHVFSFPRKEVLRKKWASVCERHFAQESILWISSNSNDSTSPSTFKSRCSSHSSSKLSPVFIKKVTYRKSRDENLLDIEKNNFFESFSRKH
nr:unnamed protein product [Callosobruchus analis]